MPMMLRVQGEWVAAAGGDGRPLLHSAGVDVGQDALSDAPDEDRRRPTCQTAAAWLHTSRQLTGPAQLTTTRLATEILQQISRP